MYISSTFPAFLSFGLLASGLVVRDIAEDVDAETLNPKTIPQTIRRLGRGENKFKKQWKNDLDTKINQIEEDLRNGDTNKVTRAVWQKNTGQAFLHETMHLDVVGQPHSKSNT